MATSRQLSPLRRAASTPALINTGASPRAVGQSQARTPQRLHLGQLRKATPQHTRSSQDLLKSQPTIQPLRPKPSNAVASPASDDGDDASSTQEEYWSPVDPASPSGYDITPAHVIQAQMRQAAAVMREATKTYIVKHDFQALFSQELTVAQGERVRLAGMSLRPAAAAHS